MSPITGGQGPDIGDRDVDLSVLANMKMDDPSLETYYEYNRLCAAHGSSVDPWAAISLYIRSPVLKLSRSARELDLVPIINLLAGPTAKFVTELHLCSMKLSPMAAKLIACFLVSDTKIKLLNVSRNHLGDEGVLFILEGLKKNATLETLDLSGNKIRRKGAWALSMAINEGRVGSLSTLRVVNNVMGQAGCDLLSQSCHSHNIVLYDEGNLLVSEILNSATHGIALLVALVGSAEMMLAAQALDWKLRTSVAVFCFTLCLLFLSSTLYHSFFRASFTKEVFQILDHSSVFLLIAGTYSPFILKYLWAAHLPPSLFGPLMFCIVWACAVFGVSMSISKNKRWFSPRLRSAFAVFMGWLVLLSVRRLYHVMERMAFLLTLFGGLAYMAGVPLYLRGKSVAMFHVAWHVAVMCGSGFHFSAIYLYVVNGPPIAAPL